jgi:general nucleoside transport system ATP-binding protein
MSEYVLEVRNITKSFPGVLANDHINLALKKGEIHAILGENGAGKSTLMNIIYGLYDPDEGQIFLNGEEVKIENPHDAISRGIGMVHQHFMLVPVFTALENIVLGSETTKGHHPGPGIGAQRGAEDL